jgi:hypothetical protein
MADQHHEAGEAAQGQEGIGPSLGHWDRAWQPFEPQGGLRTDNQHSGKSQRAEG